jgi:hypothetical protein
MPQCAEVAIEEWRSIIGFEGYYEVSNKGNVKRVNQACGTSEGKRLKPQLTWSGYQYVDLTRDGEKRQRRPVHRIVIESFVSVRLPGQQINHKDGNKANNQLSNLEYVTASENCKHAYAMGLSKAPRTKLTEQEVREIRKYAGSRTHKEIAEDYGVDKSLISHIRRRKI